MGSKFFMQTRSLWFGALVFLASCSDANFQGSSGVRTPRPNPPPPTTTLGPGSLALGITISAGQKKLDLSAGFNPKNKAALKKGDPLGEYELINGSIDVSNLDGLPEDLVKALKSSKISAKVSKEADQYLVTLTVIIPPMSISGEQVAENTLTLTQRSSSLNWLKDEGATEKFGKLEYQSSSSGCKLASTGESPRPGVYTVLLTKPATCDFSLPKLKVGTGGRGVVGAFTEIPVGSYWLHTGNKAHNFAINANYPNILIDNGFMLIQPDGVTYLLADAGHARPSAQSRTTEKIANDLSMTLGYGATKLQKPEPGNAQDNFKGSTIFKKGSVIAIYDDTPDMAGSLDIDTLISSAELGGVKLNWNAEVKK